MTDIIIQAYKCDRCGYQWAKRGDKRPKRCAKCRSPYWDEPRRERKEFDNHDGFFPSIFPHNPFIEYPSPVPQIKDDSVTTPYSATT